MGVVGAGNHECNLIGLDEIQAQESGDLADCIGEEIARRIV
jgi:hypothetical protein